VALPLGQASGGQQLTPNLNVTATAGLGGDRWGANGGGITPVGVDPGITNVQQALSRGQREANTNYLLNSYGTTQTVLADMATGAVSGQTADGGQQVPATYGPLPQASASTGAVSVNTAPTPGGTPVPQNTFGVVSADDNTQSTWTADQESPGIADSQL
jgi:hypothetical protein